MSESLRNDGRVWVPKDRRATRAAPGARSPKTRRDYFLERKYPSFGNLVPRDVASRSAKAVCDEGRGVGKPPASQSTSTSRTPSRASGEESIREPLRQPVPHVQEDHRRRSRYRRRPDADLPGDLTTPWAGCGSTTT